MAENGNVLSSARAMTRRAHWLAACAVLAFMLFKPAAMAVLRAREARRAPEAWARVPASGRFALLVPRLFAARFHDEALYASRAHRVLTHGFPYDPYWVEDRALKDWVQDFPVFYAMAGFAAVAGGDMNRGWILAGAVVAAAWLLFFDGVLFAWCGRRRVSVPLALFSILFPDLYGWVFDVNLSLSANLQRYAGVFVQQGALTRPGFYRLPAGMLSLLALAGALVALARLAGDQRPRTARAAAVGSWFGGLFLVHAYAHAFGLAALGAAAALAWLGFASAPARRNLSVAFAAALIVSAAAAALSSLGVDPRARADSLEIVGLVRTHRFYLVSLVHLAVGGAALLALARETDVRRRAAWLVLAAAQAAGFAARSAQVVTGFTVQPHHFIPLASFFGCGVLLLPFSRWLAGRSWWTRRTAAAACAVVLAGALANDAVAAKRSYRLFGLTPDEQAGVDWLRANAPKDSVVASLSMDVNELVPLYTSSSVMVPPASPPISTLYTKERYYEKTAELLSLLDVDAPRFLAERWLVPADKLAVQSELARRQRDGEPPDPELFEKAEWFQPFLWGGTADAPVLEGRARIAALAAARPSPAREPAFLWLNDGDARFLRRPPERSGWRLSLRGTAFSLYSRVPAE